MLLTNLRKVLATGKFIFFCYARFYSYSTFWSTLSKKIVDTECIALSIPLSSAWPEQGFSTLCHVKTKQCNRLLGVTLHALMNILINGPVQLTDEDVQAVAEKWQKVKKRQQVTKQGEGGRICKFKR